MCGIAGFYNIKHDKNVQERLSLAHKMEKAISHRGPDASGIWQDPDVPLSLGHRRLSIIDLSADGAQPMVSSSGRYVVSFNGEIYNYLGLQSDLVDKGYIFQGRSDTEVMLAAFDCWGVNEALQKINGMYALVLWDRQERILHFIRDRFGKKPLYVGWAGNDLVFASELKALHAHPDFTPEIDKNALALYMRYGYLHAPYSIFRNVWQILPAGRLSIAVEKLKIGENLASKIELYWSLKDSAEEGLSSISNKSEVEITNEFEGLLADAVKCRMLSDVPLGAFLSGGIDSSCVVAMMQRHSAEAVKTFSVGFKEGGYNEATYAKSIAQHLGTDHQEFYVSATDAQQVIPDLPDIYDEPFADSSQIPTFLISKLARSQVTVALTGDGGDEILGGYDRHVHIPPLWKKVSWMPYSVRRFLFSNARRLPEELIGVKAMRALSLLELKSREDIYKSLVSVWPATETRGVVLEGEVPLVPLNDERFWPRQRDNMSFADYMMLGDMLSYRANDVMVKGDRASMAVGLELRAPLMDYKLADYCWNLPLSMKVRGHEGKWLLRQVLKRYIPVGLFDRPKMGFSVPVGQWLRGPLKEWASELLSDEALNQHGLLQGDIVSRLWHEFQINDGSQMVPKHLWSILMFQAWYMRWMKK